MYILKQARKDAFKGGFTVLSKCFIMEALQMLHLTLMTCCQISALSEFDCFFPTPINPVSNLRLAHVHTDKQQ